MTNPVSNKVQTDGYVQLQGGAYKAFKGDTDLNIGVELGGKISKGGTFVKAEAGYGTAFRAGIEAGHEFNIGKNMGLELSGNAEYLRNNKEDLYSSKLSVTYNEGTAACQTTSKIRKEWHDGYKKAGIAAMFGFKGKHGNIKAGLEGGYRENNAPDISNSLCVEVHNADVTQTARLSGTFKGHESGAYVTPKISAELNLGKSGHWALTANADKFQGQAGIRYTF